jgi:hypothetical protein
MSYKSVNAPCGGGIEYLHRDPASRRRRRKGKSQIWDSKIWQRVPRDSDRRKAALARASSIYKRQTRHLVREGTPQKQDRNCQTVINIWSWGSTPRLTDWLNVSRNGTSTLTKSVNQERVFESFGQVTNTVLRTQEVLGYNFGPEARYPAWGVSCSSTAPLAKYWDNTLQRLRLAKRSFQYIIHNHLNSSWNLSFHDRAIRTTVFWVMTPVGGDQRFEVTYCLHFQCRS